MRVNSENEKKLRYQVTEDDVQRPMARVEATTRELNNSLILISRFKRINSFEIRI